MNEFECNSFWRQPVYACVCVCECVLAINNSKTTASGPVECVHNWEMAAETIFDINCQVAGRAGCSTRGAWHRQWAAWRCAVINFRSSGQQTIIIIYLAHSRLTSCTRGSCGSPRRPRQGCGWVCVCWVCVCVSFVVSWGAEMFTLSGKNGESKLMMHRTCGKEAQAQG